MGKIEETVYVCDRCGKVIDSIAVKKLFRKFKIIHFLMWITPTMSSHNVQYLCKKCYDSYIDWFNLLR